MTRAVFFWLTVIIPVGLAFVLMILFPIPSLFFLLGGLFMLGSSYSVYNKECDMCDTIVMLWAKVVAYSKKNVFNA